MDQATNMQGEEVEDLPEFTTWIKSALVLVGSIIYLIEYLLGVALWSICAAAVVYLFDYLRGQ